MSPRLSAQASNADVLSVSMMWNNELAAKNPRLKLIQSISAGTDQYDKEVLKANAPENPDDFYFSPRRAEVQRVAEARTKRKN